MVLERRVSSQLLLHRSQGQRQQSSRSCASPSPFHALSQIRNSSTLYQCDACPLQQQETRYVLFDSPKNDVARRRRHHHHHDRKSQYAGKNWMASVDLMHQACTKHADLRHQLVPFHCQGHGEDHESTCRTLASSITRHSSCFAPHRNRHLGFGRLAVCRTLSCGIISRATVQSASPCRGSPYSSSYLQDEDVHAPLESELDSLLTDPRIGRYSREQVSYLISFFNKRGMPGCRMIKKCPKLVNYRLTTLNEKLKFFEGLGFTPTQLSRLLTYAKDRTMLGLSLSNLQNHVQFLKDIGLDDQDIKKVFLQDPRFPFLNVQWNLYRALSFCIESGLNMEAFRVLARSRPTLFAYSTERFLFEKAGLLQDPLGTPSLKNLEKESVLSIYESRHALLLSRGLSKEDLYKMCKIHPQIIMLKEDTMEQKVKYLTEVLNRDVQELVIFPLFLSYSLENRIIPRFKHIDELSKRGLLKEQPSLQNVLKCTLSVFERKYALSCAKTESESSGR